MPTYCRGYKMFNNLITRLEAASKDASFVAASEKIIKFIDNCDQFVEIVKQIGTIPERLDHDSTEEKLFAKASDAVLARTLREIGLTATVLTERGDSADVIAKSRIHGYTLAADAKSFRMSRTAKNQKDFKVTALSGWRKDNDFAILCAPYFQYPRVSSQIYSQAISENVCLISWEHLVFLLENNIRETEKTNFFSIWNFSNEHSKTCTVAASKECFIGSFNQKFMEFTGCGQETLLQHFDNQIQSIQSRGISEKEYWERRKAEIQGYTREQAIQELVESLKIDGKIGQIESYIRGLRL